MPSTGNIVLILCFIILFSNGCQYGAQSSADLPYWQNHEVQIRAWAYFYQGLEYERQQKWTKATANFYRAASLDATSSRIYIHLAKTLLRLKLNEIGLRYLRQAQKYARPDDYLLYFDIGTVYQLVRLYPQARSCYEKSLAIFPGFQKGEHALATLSAEGKNTEAVLSQMMLNSLLSSP